MAVDNLGKRLRQAHLRNLSPEEKIRLNFEEARRLAEVNPGYAWRRFVAQWRRRNGGTRADG
jgi:hypothetical protein